MQRDLPESLVATAAAKPPLRFLTAGSVDDGKSTLIGRLLVDSKAILADQLAGLERRAAGAPLDLSLLTDGLEAEREQGITIDVAYRYFATPARSFTIADAPGHERYTRNMVTAASSSDAALVLVDVTKLDFAAPGEVALLPQTRRHALLAKLLRVPRIVFVVNKIDAIEDAGAAFARVRRSLLRFADEAGFEAAAIVPVSALRGDNVTRRMATPWYEGPSLLEVLESLDASEPDRSAEPLLVPVQYVGLGESGAAPGSRTRVLWGRVARGRVAVGDAIEVFPSGERAIVADLYDADGRASRVDGARSAGVVLDRHVDVSRGDWLAAPGSVVPASSVEATLAWLDTEPAVAGRKYLVRHGHRWVPGRLEAIEATIDIATLASRPAERLEVNDIGRVRFRFQEPLPLESYARERTAGALLVVDAATNRTSGALLVDSALDR